MPNSQHPNLVDLDASLSELHREVAALRAELKPVSDAYRAATLGARVLKWAVGILAGVAAIWTFYMGAPK